MYNAPYPARLAVSPMEQMEFNHLSPRNLGNIFLRHKLLILATVVAVTGVTAASQMLIRPQYLARSTTKIEFAPTEGTAGAPVPVAEKEMRMETQTKLMGSLSMAEMVVRDLKLYDDPMFTGHPPLKPGESTPERLQSRITVTTRKLQAVSEVRRQPRTQLIEVAVATQDPQLSARIADRFPVALQKWEDRARANDRRNQINGLNNKVKTVLTNLGEAERAVADFRGQHGMLAGAGTEMDLTQINNIAAEAASARANRAASYARASGIGSAGLGGEALGTSSPQLVQQRRQYEDLSRRKAELAVTFGPGYPEMQAINAQLRLLENDMAAESARAQKTALAVASADAARAAGLARSEAAGAAARSAVLSGFVGQLMSKANQSAQANGTLARLERDAQTFRDLYAETRRALESTMASRSTSTLSATVLAPASIPTESVNVTPKKKVTAALFGSLLLGFLVAFAKDMLDTKLRSASEIRRRFALPTLGMLPAIDPLLLANPYQNPVLRNPRSVFAEVARTLYLELAKKPGGGKVVAITSPLPGDGKSTVALSLAAAAMKQGARAILVDLDLRRAGILQEIQRNSGDPDLIHYITNRDSVKELIPHMRDPLHSSVATIDETGARDDQLPSILSTHERVDDPGGVISSGALHDLLRRLSSQFDLVVVNAPPVLAVRDATTLASIADETLMVIRWGETTTEELAAAIEAMGDVPVGVVFNGVDYAEHARRRHSDAIQYYSRSSAYFEDDDMAPPRSGLLARLQAMLARRQSATA